MKRSLCLAMILCVGVPVVLADRVVLPNRFLDQYGTTFQRTIMAPTGNARSYQMIFDQSQLANVPIGAQITDITYRMSPQYAPWPPEPGVSWTDYEIRIGTPATTVATMSRTFADNLSANVTLVQDGPYAIPPSYFEAGLTFPGPSLMFQQPWTYPGGDLIIDIRHPGGNFPDAAPFGYGYLEGVSTSDPKWGVLFKGLISTSFTPTTGNYTYTYVCRLEYTPEPGSILMLLLGALPLRHRRG